MTATLDETTTGSTAFNNFIKLQKSLPASKVVAKAKEKDERGTVAKINYRSLTR